MNTTCAILTPRVCNSLHTRAIVFCLLVAAGCQNTQKTDTQAVQIEQLTQQNAALKQQLEQSKAENAQLKDQVQVLSGLPEHVKLESIQPLLQVKIGRFSGFYDKNHDGRKDTLIVYIEPIDEEGDRVKAPGMVDVQLWDLNTNAAGALLGRWHVDSEQLAHDWYDTLLSTNYRCMFELPAKIDLSKPLTVKITFTDTLTGRTFTDQRVIKPQD